MRIKSLKILLKFPKILRLSYFVEIGLQISSNVLLTMSYSLGRAVKAEAVVFCGSGIKYTKTETVLNI